MYNAAGTQISGTAGYLVTTDVGGTLENVAVPTGWTFYQGYIDAPATAVYATIYMFANWSTSTGYSDFQDLRCEEYIGGDIVLDGTLAARHIDTTGLSIKDLSGNVILAAGTPLATAYVASAQNLIPNSDLTQAITWGYSQTGTSDWGYTGLRWASQEASWTTATYVLASLTTRNIYVRQDGVDATGGNTLTTMNIFPLGGYSTSYQVPAVPGQKYCFSVYFQAHRCNTVLNLTFFDGAGALLSTVTSADIGPPGGSANSLSAMTRTFVLGTAPAGTAFVRCYVSKRNTIAGQSNSYLWLAAPMLEPVGANCTGPSTYQPGGVSAVTQLGYTGALNATNNIVTSGTTAPGSPTDGDIWVDTSVTPNLTKVRVAGAWVTGAANGATIGANLYNGSSAVTANQVLNGYLDGSVTRIASPQGGSYGTSTATVTGAVKILLPQSWTNTMLRFRVDVYDYAAGASVSYDVGGYNSSSVGWTNCFATATGDPAKVKTVRFAHDGTKCCVLIGDTTSTHAYPQIRVYDFVAGYTNHAVANWDDGWVVAFITTLPSDIDVTETKPVPGGAMSGIDSITAANISTYIAAGCIGDAYIGNFIKSTGFNGTIDGSGNITANGTAGWAVSKGGNAVFNSGTFRGTLDVKGTGNDRTEITNTGVKVYSGGVLRVKLGDLT
jgi:hypothetical protein